MAQLNRGHSQVAADWRPALAGVLGGSVSTLLLHPLDLLKTRQAVHGNGESKAARAAYANVAKAVRHIVRQEGGAKALYRGVGTNVAVAGTSWGLTFMRYVTRTNNLGALDSLISFSPTAMEPLRRSWLIVTPTINP